MSKSLDVSRDITALLRARNPLLWIVTREEARVEAYVMEAAAAAGYVPYTWDCAQGIADMAGTVQPFGGPDISEALRIVENRSRAGQSRDLWMLRDAQPWLSGAIGLATCRQLRNLVRVLPLTPRATAQAIVVLSTNADVPPELADHATVIDWPMPDREEIAMILDGAVRSLPEEFAASAITNGTRDAAIDAAVGLSGEEAKSCYARSLVQLRRIDAPLIAQEKKRVIARERVLEWFDPLPGGLNAVGGLDQLKAWLDLRRRAYGTEAREYGLPAPRGMLMVGVPGCGKSLTAKAVATAWGVPLLRLDLGALKSKFVGDSEGNLRRALRVIEAIGRCVVWLDEIEKAMAGATQGAADGGVSSDALGTILSWMQERQGDAFVIATANDVSTLPPELMRKGRFDEIWFVDVPTAAERIDIVRAALRAHGRDNDGLKPFVLDELVRACEGFTGAEIAALVPDGLYQAFAEGQRTLAIADLVTAAKSVVPLTRTAADKITALRDWAKGRARPATTPEAALAAGGSRQIDL
jgi:MoxR-like ATPase